MRVIMDGRRPTAPAPTRGRQVAPVRKVAAGLYRTTDGAWEIHRDDHTATPWSATLRATGQRIARPTLLECQEAIGTGEAVAELAAQDAAALALPCRGCGEPAAGLVDTVNGPQAVCATCAPRLNAAGRAVRTPVGLVESVASGAGRCLVCGRPTGRPDELECVPCHVRQDIAVGRSTDI